MTTSRPATDTTSLVRRLNETFAGHAASATDTERSAVRRWQLCFTLPARTEPIGLVSGPGLPIGAWLGRVRCGRHGWRGRGQRRAR